jgi:putative DNA primase/helicase
MMGLPLDYTTDASGMSILKIEAIPDDLKARPQWVCYKADKIPRLALGDGYASVDDPATWATFEQAVRRFERGDMAGIGYVFTEDDPYCGADLDDSIRDDGQLTEEARDIVDGLWSYTERSPSGKGLHIITIATLRESVKTASVELYDRGRYFTFTGDRWPGTPGEINERQGAIDILLDELRPAQSEPRPTAQPAPQVLTLADSELITRARGFKNGAKFSALFDGDTSGYNGDDSRADLALCSLLAFVGNNDPATIDRLFRASKLYRPDKWDTLHRQHPSPATYGQMTIERALQRNSQDVYTPSIPVTLVKNGHPIAPPSNGNLALAPIPIHTETPTEGGSEPIKLRLADIWQRDLLKLGVPPETPPQREYILDFLPVPSVNLWTGLPGGKKSLLLQDAAISEASGQYWLPRKGDTGTYETFGDVQGQGRPVLYIDYDMGRNLSEERFYALARHRGIGNLADIPLHVLSVSAPMDLYNLQPAEELTELIHRLGAKFVVIDTLIDVKGAARENEDSMGVVFSNLRRISQQAKCSVNVIHHPAKNGSPDAPYRGFSGIAGKLDLGITLAKRGYEITEPVDVSFFKVRGAPPKPFSAMFQIETHPADWRTLWRASFVGISPPANVLGDAAIRDTFRETLEDNEGLGKTELIKRVHLKLSNQKVSRAQTEAMYYTLLSENAIVAEDTGKDNKTAHRWTIE